MGYVVPNPVDSLTSFYILIFCAYTIMIVIVLDIFIIIEKFLMPIKIEEKIYDLIENILCKILLK